MNYLNIRIGWHNLSVLYCNADKNVLEKIRRMFPFIESKKRNKYLITVVFNKPSHGNEIKINNMTSLVILNNNAFLYWKNIKSFPTLYRALYIFSQYVHLKNGAFLIHALGLKENSCGYIFAGHSGSGKTTIAQKMPVENLLNDEAVAIKRVKDNYYVKGTPFGIYYSDTQERIRLKSLFLLNPARKTSIKKIRYPLSVSQLIVHIPFLYYLPPELRKTAFHLLAGLSKKIPIFYANLTLKANIKKIIECTRSGHPHRN